MHFSIEKEIFLKGLSRVQGIVEKKNTIPILSNVLLQAGESHLKITATDLEVGMQSIYPASVTKPGRITVPAKKLFEIIKELPESEIFFTAKDNSWIEIRCGKSVFNIVGLSADEFPFFPNIEEDEFIIIERHKIKELIEKTIFSMSMDETKYNLNGIFIKIFEEEGTKKIRFVATDGHRLSLKETNFEGVAAENLEKGVIFPKKGVIELRKMADEADGPIHLGFMDNNAVLKKNNSIIIMRIVDGEFPDYNRVIPKNNNLNSIIDRNTFLHALRRMSILSSEKSKGVKIDFKTDFLELSSSNPDLGDAREDLSAEYNGEEVSIGFNARYLIDILSSLDSEKICFSVKDQLSPGLITAVSDNEYLAVIMPMRL
jgi:DNA polymerase III subunit beta